MNILKEIILNKKQELKEVKSNWKKFKKIFKAKNANIIWEIKLASPKYDYSVDGIMHLVHKWKYPMHKFLNKERKKSSK